MLNIRPTLAATALATLLTTALAGCMAPVRAVDAIERSAAQREFDSAVIVLRAHIKALQDKGDPLGDYFYALGNSDGWITEVTDPKAITALFEKAAARGSMDAKILLALQLAVDDEAPGRLDFGHLPNGNLDKWERGLAHLMPLLEKQCSARRLVLDMNKPRVRYYSIAYEIWPTYRDGRSIQNKQGHWVTLVPKNSERQKVWESIDRQCPTPQDEWLRP